MLIGGAMGMMSPKPAATYRYLRLRVTAGSSPILFCEHRWVVSGTNYPTVNMTSNTAPSPLVASVSNGSASAYIEMDGSVSGYLNVGNAPVWHTIDLGSGNGIAPTGVSITVYSATYYFGTFSCYGSNTGAFAGEETLLGTFSPGSTGWTGGVARNFTF